MANLFDPDWDAERDAPPFRWRRARLGRQAGSRDLGASLFEVPPGAATFPLHIHHANEELLLVLSGRPTLRTPDGERLLEPGEVVAFPAGREGGHAIDNHGDEPARYVIVSTMRAPEINEFPELGTFWVRDFAPGRDAPEGALDVDGLKPSQVLGLLLTTAAIAGVTPAPDAGDAYALARSLALAGPRPAASAAERRAHATVEERFRRAGLRIGHDRFTVPAKGRSRNVLGIRDGHSDCLRVLMAHTDSVPPAPGADDNASGVGALVALAAAVGAAPQPPCDTWFVATGSEERPYTKQADHLGALALARRLRRYGRTRDVRFGLSLDEVGRGTSFWLRSPASAPRVNVERSLLAAARRAGVSVRWVRDGSDSNSDHRELEHAGMPAMKLGVPDDPCRHTSCDTVDRLQRGAFTRVLRVVAQLLD